MGAGAMGQAAVPAWCRTLPRPEYKSLERVPVKDGWFEVYLGRPEDVGHLWTASVRKTISYLIVGRLWAMLFDTGMGIGNLKALTVELTRLPIVVLDSHTHNDHVGDNWQFDTVYSMDTSFSRRNAQGSREAAQAEIRPGETCGTLPTGFDPKAMRRVRGKLHPSSTMASGSIWEGGGYRLLPRQVTRRTLSRCLSLRRGCCSPGTRFIRGRFGCIVRKQIWQRTTARCGGWQHWLRR